MAKTVQSRKAKGRRCSQETRDLLLKYAPDLENHIRVTSMGANGADVWLSPEAFKKFPLIIENKACEAFSPWAAYEQACSHAKEYAQYETKGYPAVFYRRNRSELMVTLKAEDFIKLIA
jgi:hypothetical protein